MAFISDEAETFLRLHHLEEEIHEERQEMMRYVEVRQSLESMGFEIVEHVCDQCMFVVRGGQIATPGNKMDHS